MDISEIKDLITGVGFPIVVALYHMVYLERSLRRLTEAIARLTEGKK